jgi:sulfate-transporting ATPase
VRQLNILLLGLGNGGIYALLGQSTVLVYRGSRVLNLASAAIGMFGAYVFYHLWLQHGIPLGIALIIGLGAGGAVGAVMYLAVIDRLTGSSRMASIVATLALMTTLIGVCGQVFAPGGAAESEPSLLPVGYLVPFHDLRIPEAQGLMALIAVGVTILLVVLSRGTRLGLATIAAAENPTVLAATGTSPRLVACLTWTAGSVLATGAVILVAGFSGLATSSVPLLIVPALAAALAGSLDSFELTLLGGLVIGALQSEIVDHVSTPGWPDAVPLLMIVAILLLRGRNLPSKAHRSERIGSVGPGKIGPIGLAAIGAGVALIFLVHTDWLPAVTSTILLAFIVMSVVLVTGYGGQISLAQGSLAGIAAFLEAVFVIDLHVGLPAAIVLGIILTVPVGVLVAVPAVRTRGYELAIITLALASIADDLIFNNPSTLSSVLSKSLGSLTVFGHDISPLSNPRTFALITFVIVLVVGRAVANVRRGFAGRRLLAVRSNERAAAALGISVPRVKLGAVAGAALVAAIGGALIEAQYPFPQFSGFDVFSSVNFVLYAVIGGIGWVSGVPVGAAAAPGALSTRVLGLWISPSNWLEIASGLAVLVLILQSPDGIVPLNLRQINALRAKLRKRPAAAKKVDPRQLVATAPVGLASRSPDEEYVLAVKDLSVRFGGIYAVKDFNLELRSGEIVGLIGPNGAGKSTIVETICGFERPAEGRIILNGRDITRLPPDQRARSGIGRTFQSIELFDDSTVLDNIGAAVRPERATQYVRDLVVPSPPVIPHGAVSAMGELGVLDHLDAKPAALDYWLRRAVGVARALAQEPRILILDEPAAGSDARSRAELKNLLKELATLQRVGVVVIEHDVEFVFDLCDRVVALDTGLVIAEGSPQEVRRDPGVIASYLGATEEEGTAGVVSVKGTGR